MKAIILFSLFFLVLVTELATSNSDPYIRSTDLQNLPEPSIDASLYPINCSIHVEEWLPLSFSFPGHVATCASAVVGGKLLMFNIPSESHLLSRKDCVVDSFDPLIDSWTRFRSHQIPIKGDRILLTSDGTRYAYLAIGTHSPIHYFDRGHTLTGLWRYDTANNEWTDVPQIPHSMILGGLSFSGKYLHLVGSAPTRDSKKVECAHWRLDTAATFPKWVRVAALPRCRGNFHVVSLRDTVYVLGGTKMEGERVIALDYIDRYDVNTDSWTSANIPLAISQIDSSVAVIYDTLAVITTMSKDAVSHLIEFDTVAETWSSLVPLPRKLTHPVHFGLLSDVTWQGMKGDFIVVVSDINTLYPLAYMGRIIYPNECKLRAKKNVHPPKGVCEVLPHQP